MHELSTAWKMKFPIFDLSSKYQQILKKLEIKLDLLKKSSVQNFKFVQSLEDLELPISILYHSMHQLCKKHNHSSFGNGRPKIYCLAHLFWMLSRFWLFYKKAESWF